MKYRNLFSQGKIGTLNLKNRIVMPPMGTNLAGPIGEVTDHLIAYYEERAKGGTGLIIVEFTSIDYEFGKGFINQLRIDQDRFIPGIHRLANAVHKYGAKMFVQIHHAGRQASSNLIEGKQIVAPSPVTCAMIGEEPRELTTAEVKELVTKFVSAAERCKRAGVDGVEVHAAHGYLINQFLSPYTNLRTDEYGGSFENRMRFIEEIIDGIKETCGPAYPVTVRLSADEFVDGGIDLELAKEISRYLEKLGVDGLHISGGNYDSLDKVIESALYQQGWRVYLAEAIKKEVSIPVITVGVIREPEFAEAILTEGKADFIAIGRGHIADPEWARKTLEGREAEIRRCISCLHCIKSTLNNSHVECSINIRAGRELEFREMTRIEDQRRVAIVGGGPGGMEAARILSLKGYDVTIFEKSGQLGGQLNLVRQPVAKEKMDWMIEYHRQEMARLNVDVRLNTEASIEAIKSLNPYAVLLATGAKPIIPKMAGVDASFVCDYEDVLLARRDFTNKKIAVVGSGMVCYSITSQLARQGSEVILIEVPTETGSKVTPPTRAMLLERIRKANGQVVTGHVLTEILLDGIIVEDVETGDYSELGIDYLVFSMGTEAFNPLEESYHAHFENVFVIGDAETPGSITHAIKDGFEKAMVIESLVMSRGILETV